MRRSKLGFADVPGVLHVCSPEEAAAWRQRWLAVYGRDRHGVNAKDFLWHIFSAGRYPSLGGQAARAAYDTHEAVRYIVMSNDQRSLFVLDRKPVDWPESDHTVFPENLAWTMAFTHEEGWLGPYFAQHRDHARLDAQNQSALRHELEKRRQIEQARAKGWC